MIFINDLVNSSTTGDFVLFADDTNIFVPGNTVIEPYENAQNVLNGIHEFILSIQLHINLTKSVYTGIRKNLKLGNFTIEKSENYLGEWG